ncbi:hypothetical protein GGI25_003122 [Coemansia spiralis]|uniref:Uncharacterized protein n=2 Tax=Coemansia TaxID=4863 RepID=A0A9W8G6K0_9FUNG|nr:hypothetical protein EDC05_003258 [Coemansia umbellata]KAJ2621734.1 hypothetical protein GGI26_003829 [Coemansia sp. RSA 1358]KAJ2677487.1 hypothetical protein GGI25_003122 [Coemansia spiralis]
MASLTARDMFSQLKGIDSIYCPQKDCINERDWLVYKPTSAALWVLGSIMLALAILYMSLFRPLRVTHYNSSSVRLIAIFLTISLYLRAALTRTSGDKKALYIGSMIFNYISGECLYDGLFANSIFLVTGYMKPSAPIRALYACLGIVQGWGEFALAVAGPTLMFHPHSGHVAVGRTCLRVITGFLMSATFFIAVAFAFRFRAVSYFMSKRGILSTIIVILMLELWSSYMFARLFVDLDNPARDSETVFFLLNVLPLIIGILAYLVLGEPLSGRVDLSNIVDEMSITKYEKAMEAEQAKHAEQAKQAEQKGQAQQETIEAPKEELIESELSESEPSKAASKV